MRCHPLVIKWSCLIATKCHQKGYDVIRSILPIPTWETVRQYRKAARTTNPISEQNLAFMVREMRKRDCKEVGGIHWNEMIVKEGTVLCKRTGELVGFEHLTINSELNMGPNNLQNVDDENTTESSDSDTIGPFDSDSDTNEMFSNEESANPSEKAKPNIFASFFIHQ